MAGLVAFGIAVCSAGPMVLAGGESPRPRAPMPEGARVELGRRLFFDPAASRSGMRSCADCHDPQHGYSDEVALSADSRGDTPRHTQTLVDCVDSPTMDWAGALKKIEEVVTQRVEPTATRPSGPQPYYKPLPPITPGLQFLSAKVPDIAIPMAEDQLRAARRYSYAFNAAYGESEPSTERIIGAISAYCRSIKSGECAYDRYEAGDTGALSASAKRGLALFRGKAGCTSCHLMEGKRPTFSDYRFHQTALPEVAIPVAVTVGGFPVKRLAALPSGVVIPLPEIVVAGPVFAPPAGGKRGWKTPTLRDVAARGPYMHNGSLPTLEAVVRFFLSGVRSQPGVDPMVDPMMPSYAANDADVEDLLAFLGSLSSDVRPGASRVAWSLRATRTRLHFVDADGKSLALWPVVLAPAGDSVPGKAPAELLRLTTDRDGWVTYAPPPTTHVRVVLEGGLRPEGGCWIPDTCREAKVTIPIQGIGHVRVTFPADTAVPDRLELLHEGATYNPDRRTPRTVLRMDGTVETAGRRSVAVYSGWIRTDVPASATLLVPKNLSGDGRALQKVTLDPTITVGVHLED